MGPQRPQIQDLQISESVGPNPTALPSQSPRRQPELHRRPQASECFIRPINVTCSFPRKLGESCVFLAPRPHKTLMAGLQLGPGWVWRVVGSNTCRILFQERLWAKLLRPPNGPGEMTNRPLGWSGHPLSGVHSQDDSGRRFRSECPLQTASLCHPCICRLLFFTALRPQMEPTTGCVFV